MPLGPRCALLTIKPKKDAAYYSTSLSPKLFKGARARHKNLLNCDALDNNGWKNTVNIVIPSPFALQIKIRDSQMVNAA
jgi:hypothetical protein